MSLLDELPLNRKHIDSLLDSTARINIWTGAISSGKTITSLIRWLDYVATAPTGGDLLMVGKTNQTIHRNLFVPLTNPDLFGELSKHVHYTPGAPTAQIFGRTIHIIGANDAKSEGKIRGFTAAGAYVDEATLVPKDFWNQLIGRLRVPGAKLFATTNPDSPMHWLRTDYIMNEASGVRTWHFTLEDNKHLDAEYVQSLKDQYFGLYYRRFILGEWVAAEGAIYDIFDSTKHIEHELPAINEWISVGIDYGTSNPFSAVLIGMGVDGRLHVVSEFRYESRVTRRQLTDVEYSERLQNWLKDPAGDGHYRITHTPVIAIDPSAASFVAQLYREGLHPYNANNSVEDGIRVVHSLLGADKLRVHSSCKGVIDEFPAYSWDDTAAEKGVDKPLKVADHSMDALRYALKTTENVWRRYFPDLRAA